MAETVPDEPWLNVNCSRDFAAWLSRERVSLAFTTYQSHKLFLLGIGPDGRPAVCERTFPNCMGLWADGQTLWLATKYQIWRFANALTPGQLYEGATGSSSPEPGTPPAIWTHTTWWSRTPVGWCS